MSETVDVVVVGAVRTPIGRFGGGMAGMSAAAMGTAAAAASLQRCAVDPADVDELIFGNARQAGGGPNPARQIAHLAGLPPEVPAFTVNKACGSGLKAIVLAAQAIRLGDASIVLAGGTESMSGVPHLLPEIRFGKPEGDVPIADGMYRDGFICPLCGKVMGETAETLADRYSISREEQDAYAARSQQRCEAARRAGLFEEEIVPVEVPGSGGGAPSRLAHDEHPRDGVTAGRLAGLPPVFRKGGTVHAGNSSGITDGAAAVLVMTAKEAARRGLRNAYRITGYASAGVDAGIMGLGPVPALRRLQERTGVNPLEADLVELNEASGRR